MFLTDDNTHNVEITISSIYPQKEVEQIRLKVGGDGSIEYFIDSMKAALLAFGFCAETVQRIGFKQPGDEE